MANNQHHPLTNLEVGKAAIVCQILTGIHGKALTNRLKSLGLVSGKKVKILRKLWWGKTLHVKVGATTTIALRDEEAKLIIVKPTSGQ
ncbi:MAG: ferrous iron transport protein A [Geminocystis sp.]|nr:ferrous iron transport protein A [Geminocystis sp.]HIK38096.1 ferrous iron transport protein A [Geminocystis sp. M7585_C2015_104]MCS7149046.1 ferrous iron transport protein A [Geminocystis sp.]MCX8077755.1 ferrous iron transport protein A [Geminocystis sp.]MDW8117123.1 FeoA family protein [Geminocystis sp.]